ncbi:hypothetical protein HUS23_08150 [Ectothiorhodospiraceae bacterium 2226]|nr:hypothetical protein HUS23_08150 [Ectothiorhodospiraceae bacterium 2226]
MPPKLALRRVLRATVAIPWRNRAAFVRVLAAPVVALVVMDLVVEWAEHALGGWRSVVLSVAWWALFVVIAVRTHRLVLAKDEEQMAKASLRWSWRETRFFGWLLVIYFQVALLGLLLAMLGLAIMWVVPSGPFQLMVVVAVLPAAYLLARLSLIFPAVALDRPVDFGWAWARSAGNGWRLVLVVAVLPLAFSVVATAANSALVAAVLAAPLVVLEVVALSAAYRALVVETAPAGVGH